MLINSQLRKLLLQALQEDIGRGDLTTQFIVSRNQKCKAIIISKSEGILAGLLVATLTFKLLHSKVTFKSLEKDGVKVGGGTNHRFGLDEMLLIKDNHIQAAGSVSLAIKLAKQKNKKRLPLEVETKNLREVRETLKAGVTFIMLDNFSLKNLKLSVKIIRDFEQKNMKKIKIEASGNVSLKNVKKIAQTGVNLISVGKITHSAPALDFSLKIL